MAVQGHEALKLKNQLLEIQNKRLREIIKETRDIKKRKIKIVKVICRSYRYDGRKTT